MTPEEKIQYVDVGLRLLNIELHKEILNKVIKVIEIVDNKKGKARLLDVKSVSYRKTRSYNCRIGTTINRSVSKKQKELGVEIYYVNGN